MVKKIGSVRCFLPYKFVLKVEGREDLEGWLISLGVVEMLAAKRGQWKF